MSNILDASKSNLGKLLAAENIRIEHRQVPGPSFDVKNRVLTLPMWKSVDADLYDLMIGHEVGHALFTPAEGWVDKVKEYGKSFKTMLNLVEDARIEKKMKRKYPGLRKPMYNGYTQLVDRGFFGVNWDDMNSLPFIDRINIYFKLGSRSNVTFNENEQDLVNRVDAAETWDEVLSLAKELLDVANGEASDMQDALNDLIEALENNNFGEGESDGDGNNQGNNTAEGDSVQDILDKLRKEGKHELADRLENASEKALEKMKKQMMNAEGEVTSITSDAMEENQHKLVDEKSAPNCYVTFPKLDSSKWVTPARVTHSLMTFPPEFDIKRESIYNEFMTSNKRYISYLVREFELRRNATQFAKAKVSKTGKLDMDKMWQHKLSENLFLQTTIVPNGKNHGMLMLIDLSSSMFSNMAGTIEQLVTMAMFCRKVNIPFDVYGFTDNGYYHLEQGMERKFTYDDGYEDYSAERQELLNSRNDMAPNTLQIRSDSFRLKQLLHSNMPAAEFTHSIKNLLLLAEAFRLSHSYYGSYSVPNTMELGGTPLNEAILVLKDVADKFKKATRIEVLSTIILTDGDASYGLSYRDETSDVKGMDNKFRFILEDKATHHQVKLSTYRLTDSLLEMYRHLTDSRMIGFYLMSGRNYRGEIQRRAVYGENFNDVEFDKKFKEEFTSNRFFGITGLPGYDVYFMMPGSDLEIDNVTMDSILKKNDKGSLLRAFKKMQNTKMVSRVFLNQFIKQVA
jgi:hypothetical protein